MKTSSKLLIILAVAIFVLPLSILSYTVTRGRVGVDEYSKTFHEEATQSDKEDQYLKTTALPAFQKVKIIGHSHNPGNITLVYVKSDQYAVKVDKNRSSSFTATVNAEGVLIITGDEPHFYHNIFYIFSPSAQELMLKHVGVKIEVDTERLMVHADSITELRFSPESSIKELIVELKNSSVSMSNPRQEGAQSRSTIVHAKLNVVGSDVRLESPNFDKMQITTSNSNIVFDSRYSGSSIKALELLTHGKNTISLDSLHVENLQGGLSEETTIDLPIYQLRKLMTNK